MNAMEKELNARGFARSPNNPHGLVSCADCRSSPVWYSVTGRVLPLDVECQVCSDRIRLFRLQFFGEQYSKRSFWDTVTIAVFADVAEFMAWFRDNSIARPAGGANVWD